MNPPAGRFRPSFVPALFTGLVVLVCLGLGVWQLERLAWKRALIAERQAAAQAAPVPAPRSLAEGRALQFHPVVAEGVFLHDKEMHVIAPGPTGGSGYYVLTPLRTADGRVVFVNRGFVPVDRRDPAKREAGQIAGTTRVTGMLRLAPGAKPSWFTPDHRPELNYWFWADLLAMAAAAGLSDVAPFYIEADATPNPGGWPKGGVTPTALANDHLQYAITWFALAGAALVVYVFWRRQTAGRDDSIPGT
jgi:surfeit locus 1 family protein